MRRGPAALVMVHVLASVIVIAGELPAAPSAGPILAVSCSLIEVRCASGHPPPANRGDTVVVHVEIANNGDAAASDLEGSVSLYDSIVASPPGAVFQFPLLPPGSSVAFTLVAEIGLTCATTFPELELSNLRSDGGAQTYPPLVCAGAVEIDCATICSPSCLVGGLGAIRPLLAVKSVARPPRDAVFTWPADPAGPPGYHLNAVSVKSDITETRAKRDPVGVGQAICTTAVPECTHVDAVVAPEALLFYQAFSACGDRGDQEGRF